MCPRCGDDILTDEERRARRASYERLLVELEAAREEIARLSHELRLLRSRPAITVPGSSNCVTCQDGLGCAQCGAAHPMKETRKT